MGNVVIGHVISNSYARKSARCIHKEEITPQDRMLVALDEQGNHKEDIQKILERLNLNFIDSPTIPCLLYNATGNLITFVKYYHWSGTVGIVPYPQKTWNGQWSAWIYSVADKSTAVNETPTLVGAAVYRATVEIDASNTKNVECLIACAITIKNGKTVFLPYVSIKDTITSEDVDNVTESLSQGDSRLKYTHGGVKAAIDSTTNYITATIKLKTAK